MKASRVIMVKNRLERLTHEREEDTTMIKILLVEDDLGLSNSVFDFLDDFADVMQVFDGEEGLYEAESGIYDLILLDLMLPEKDGFHVLKELREKGVTTPVLIMTAKESLDDKGHGFELGADDYLTKPFYLEELKMRIQALLKRSGKVNENTLNYGNLKVNFLGRNLIFWSISFKTKMSSFQRPRSSIVSGALIVTQPSQWLKSMFQKSVRN